jgi:hypothetical protein
MVPKLVDFDWRVDIKMSSQISNSDEMNKSGQQTCILQLKVNQIFIIFYLYLRKFLDELG